MASFSYQEPDSPFEMLMGGMRGGQDYLQKMRMNPKLLKQQELENAMKEYEKQYKPLTLQSEAASKLAYANLMGPQFLSKLMQNPDILASIPEDKKGDLLSLLVNAGSGQGTGRGQMQNQPQRPQENRGENETSLLSNPNFNEVLKSQLNNKNSRQNNMNPDISNLSSQDQSAVGNMQPGDEYVIQNYNQSNQPKSQNTFAENAGNYLGIKEEGKEAGKIRAKDISDLNNIVFNADTNSATLTDIGEIISSPEMREIRQIPLAGRHEMAYYAKEGTPAQQQLVGRLSTQMGNIIKDSSRDFAGQFRKGEQQLLEGMKPSPSDTVDVMIGKAESLMTMNKLLRERAALTSQYMSENHINKLEASKLADKNINADQIRSSIHNKLNPKPNDEDIKFMAGKYNKTPAEIKKMLKAKGVL